MILILTIAAFILAWMLLGDLVMSRFTQDWDR